MQGGQFRFERLLVGETRDAREENSRKGAKAREEKTS